MEKGVSRSEKDYPLFDTIITSIHPITLIYPL